MKEWHTRLIQESELTVVGSSVHPPSFVMKVAFSEGSPISKGDKLGHDQGCPILFNQQELLI